ncbi:MAG: sigma-70 family RNA polymerase sigma factor [bacterium]
MEFEELVKRFSSKIKHLASKTFISSQMIDREDLYQEMVYHLWERWRRGELEGKTDAYIMGSCYFYLKNYLRKNKEKTKIISLNEPIGEGKEEIGELIPDQKPLIDERIDDILFVRRIMQKGLKQREKEVATFLSEGWTLRGIGEKLGISHVMVLKIKKDIEKKIKAQGKPCLSQ